MLRMAVPRPNSVIIHACVAGWQLRLWGRLCLRFRPWGKGTAEEASVAMPDLPPTVGFQAMGEWRSAGDLALQLLFEVLTSVADLVGQGSSTVHASSRAGHISGTAAITDIHTMDTPTITATMATTQPTIMLITVNTLQIRTIGCNNRRKSTVSKTKSIVFGRSARLEQVRPRQRMTCTH